MNPSYHINPTDFTLQRLADSLMDRELIPSRQPLKEGLETKLKLLDDIGIKNLEDLLKALKNKGKLEDLSLKTGISREYLTLLRREANSYFPNPVPLKKFSGISPDDIQKLENLGIKHSRHLFERVGTEEKRSSLSEKTGISMVSLRELVGLSDLVRAYGVGPVFARILYDTGIKSIRELVMKSPREIIQLYEDKFQQKADFSLRDMEFSLEVAQSLGLGVDF
jgi:hypothetical protein